jgi:hypothetical protein
MPLTILIEPSCDQYEVAAGGEAIVTLEDGHPHSFEIHQDQHISIWNEGVEPAVVELFTARQCSYPARTMLWK